MADIALLTGAAPADRDGSLDGSLRLALSARGMTGHLVGWEDRSVDWARFDLAIVRTMGAVRWDREGLLAAARRIGAATTLWNPTEVLRWNSHRSYLLELEERGAPIVPTAWMARGDEVDLGALLAARGWASAVISPADAGAVGSALQVTTGGAGLGGGQRHLDELLATGDALVQPDLTVQGGDRRSVVVIDGQVTHIVRPADGPGSAGEVPDVGTVPGSGGVQASGSDADPESAALARWVVDATGVALLYARVEVIDDASQIPQVLHVDAVAPELHLGLVPQAADALAAAIGRRIGG